MWLQDRNFGANDEIAERWWIDDISASNFLPDYYYRTAGGDMTYAERIGIHGISAMLDVDAGKHPADAWQEIYLDMQSKMLRMMHVVVRGDDSISRNVASDDYNRDVDVVHPDWEGTVLRLAGDIKPVIWGGFYVMKVTIAIDIGGILETR